MRFACQAKYWPCHALRSTQRITSSSEQYLKISLDRGKIFFAGGVVFTKTKMITGSYRLALFASENRMRNSQANQGNYCHCVKRKIRKVSNFAFFALQAITWVPFNALPYSDANYAARITHVLRLVMAHLDVRQNHASPQCGVAKLGMILIFAAPHCGSL